MTNILIRETDTTRLFMSVSTQYWPVPVEYAVLLEYSTLYGIKKLTTVIYDRRYASGRRYSRAYAAGREGA